MSQAGIIAIEEAFPQIATQYDADSGNAIPLANVLTINGMTVANGLYATPIFTTGSGNTITINQQVGTAITGAPADKKDAGIVSFDDTAFAVDANGYVTLTGGGGATTNIDVDASTAPGTDPVVPSMGNIIMTGGQVATGVVGANVIRTNSLATSKVTIEIQRSTTAAAADSTLNGVAHFDSSAFSVDANGFVTLAGGTGPAVDSFTTDIAGPVVPSATGAIDVTGTSVFSNGTVSNTIALNVQATANTFLLGAGAGTTATELGPLTNGQLIIGSTGSAPVTGTLTAGTGITITNAAGTITIDADNNGTVTSVSGTLNRISIGGTATDPVVDIDAAYVGQTSITTLGTVTTGTWQGTTVGEGFGGTGQSTYATGDILYASAANTLSKLAAGANGEVLTLAGGVPTWAPDGGGTITSVLTANATPQFNLVGSTSTVDFDLSNLVLGTDLPAVTTGVQNVGMGQDVFLSLTSGNSNTAIGFTALSGLTTSANNTAIGFDALSATPGNNNTAVGYQALKACTDTANTAIGVSAMIVATTAEKNVAVGLGAMSSLTEGDRNVAVGQTALNSITTGINNTAVGDAAGSSLTTTDSNNVLIRSNGISGDNRTTRIGSTDPTTGQTKAFMAGITGVTVAASEPMAIDTNGQMSGLGFGTANQVLTSGGAGVSPSWDSTLDVTSITFDGGTNTLSEYEEGTFTPELTGGGSAPTISYTTQQGLYVRIGRLVYYKWSIHVNTISGGSGTTLITGLPFTSANDALIVRHILSTSRVDWPASVTTVLQSIGTNLTSIALIGDIDNASSVSLDISGVANTDFLLGTGFYWV